MGRPRKYTDKEFIQAVKDSFSIRQVLKTIGLRPTGGNYDVAKRRIEDLGIDNSHFTGQGHLKGKNHNWAPKIPLREILVKDSKYAGGTHKLKKRLIKEGILEDKCYECGITEWRKKPLPLELEHKNGDRYDNRIENLTILCPNCHSQTPTHTGKNKGKYV